MPKKHRPKPLVGFYTRYNARDVERVTLRALRQSGRDRQYEKAQAQFATIEDDDYPQARKLAAYYIDIIDVT